MHDAVALLRSDVAAWNRLRAEEQGPIDLVGVDLSGADLRGVSLLEANLLSANLASSDLTGADLRRANFRGANLSRSNLDRTQLYRANFNRADLEEASLRGADLYRAYLGRTNLARADLRGADLKRAVFVDVDLGGARISCAEVHGLSAWDVRGDVAEQQDLIVTPPGEPKVTVDDLKMAQFIYLLISNPEIRDIVDTVTSKMVLILGRFADERKAVLDALRERLRERDRTPVLFDFAVPESRGYGETVALLARMSRYVIADLTDAAEIRSELMQIVPQMPRLPVLPIILAGSPEYTTFATDIAPYPWVLPTHQYESQADLISNIDEVVAPADQRFVELTDAPTRTH